MDLIYYRGLNCHLACVVNLAHALGVNYPEAFATLWSETDFTDEVKYHIYVSKRVFTNLEAIGVIIEALDCGGPETRESLARIANGERFLVGMDTFYIPWHPVYGHFHDPHYFFAQKETEDSFLCFDPVYNKKYQRIGASDIDSAAFELCRTYKIEASPPMNSVEREAREVLRCHPVIIEKLRPEILGCGGEGKAGIAVLLKQLNAMINNRYLYRRFFFEAPSVADRYEHFFSDTYFLKWEAVRNGLYKASIVKDNKNVIAEVYELFNGLMSEEIAMAKEIVCMDTR